MTTYKDVVRATYRYGRPSFLRGFASALDLFGVIPSGMQTTRFGSEEDACAIAEDWKIVGQDLRDAFERAGCK